LEPSADRRDKDPKEAERLPCPLHLPSGAIGTVSMGEFSRERKLRRIHRMGTPLRIFCDFGQFLWMDPPACLSLQQALFQSPPI